MKCQNCLNEISNSFHCLNCSNNFCSLSCLTFHYSVYHYNNNISNIYTKHQKIINSPFLVEGTFNDSIIYDSTYSLKNFVPVYSHERKIKTIGSGSYGQVYLGFNTLTKKYYAIKHMDKRNIINLLHSLSSIQKEIEIQSKIDHPNIVKLLYVKETDLSYDLIMEYAPGGNLFHFIRKNKGLNENLSFKLFIQVVNSIYFLHKNDFIHRDIKPENILMFENNIVKLCDFGWCVRLNGEQRGTFCGTTEYMSPELVNRTGYGKENDVWSLGVLLYEMIHGYSPFKPNKTVFDENDVMENIINHNITFQKNISPECKKLIYGLLDPNINNRYTVEDIYNSEFIKKYEQIQFGLNNKSTNNINISNIKWVNQSPVNTQNQINNIIYSPQIEMNNNINIHMSMDTNNYVYNIQIPEKKNGYKFQENNGIKLRNQSFPKVNKGIYSNYINSSNNHGNLLSNILFDDNYYLDTNTENKIINSKSNDNNQVNEKEVNFIYNNISNKEKLISNKTWDNFYPINIGKNKEQELIDIYTSHNNDYFQNDYKRDNKEFINFNNSIFYFPGQNDYTYNNELNDNLQLNNINKSDCVKINNPKDETSSVEKIQSISYNNNISNLDNSSLNYNYYNNIINNLSYSSNNNKPIQSSLMKRAPTNNYNFDINTFNQNISISSIPTTNTKIISENQKINENNNNINYISKSSILQSVNSRITKVSEFDIEDYILNDKNENDDIKVIINSYNRPLNENKNNEYKLDNYNQQKIKKEKEPVDNMLGKEKTKNDYGKIKGINSSENVGTNNYIKNNSLILINKSEGIYNFQKNQLQKKTSVKNEDKKENKKDKNDKESNKSGIPFFKNVSFDQPKELLIFNNKKSNKISLLQKSKSVCDKEKLQRMKKKKSNNLNRERNNLTNDKAYNKKQKIIKYLYRQKNDKKSYSNLNDLSEIKTAKETENTNNKNFKEAEQDKNNNSITDVSCSLLNIIYSKRDNSDMKISKNNSKINVTNINNSVINQNQKYFVSKSHDKKPKNNKKYHRKKELLIPKSPMAKVKLQKNCKLGDDANFIGYTPYPKSYINLTNNSNTSNKSANKTAQNYTSYKSKNKIKKYLKINRTTDEKKNALKKRIDLSNLNKINVNKSNKESLNSGKKENQKLLKPSCSLKIISQSEKIKANNISKINANVTKIQYIKKNKVKDFSNDNNKNKYKRKINNKKEIASLKETESIIINNTSDFNDTNEERSTTPKKKFISNKVKPNKLLEAFKKELAQRSKRDNILKPKK